MEKRDDHDNKGLCWCCGPRGGVSHLGIFLLILGAYLFAQAFGWISGSFPFWGAVAVLAGLYLLLGKRRK